MVAYLTLDSSVIIAALRRQEERHSECRSLLEKVKNVYSSTTLVTHPSSSRFKKVVNVSLSFVIARHAVPKQSRREEATVRLLRFARNDMEARIRYATFW